MDFFLITAAYRDEQGNTSNNKEYSKRIRGYFNERKEASLPCEFKTLEQAEAALPKLQGIASKHGVSLEICEASTL